MDGPPTNTIGVEIALRGDVDVGHFVGFAPRIPMTDTAYPLRGTGLSLLLTSEWRRPEDRARSERWVADTGAALRPWARRAYVNSIPPSPPERIREIYGVNYPRLARIKARYDPANLFRSNQNVLPSKVSIMPFRNRKRPGDQ